MAWEISMSQEGWDAVEQNLNNKDDQWLKQAIVDDVLVGLGTTNAEFLDLAEKTMRKKYDKLPHDVLVEDAIRRIRANNTCSNGGFEVYVDKGMLHSVPVELEIEIEIK